LLVSVLLWGPVAVDSLPTNGSAAMQDADDFSTYHAGLLEGRYDCVDRIVLNAYFPLGQGGGGFRHWWRQLTGSDETLDNEHLLRMAGDFSRRVHAYAQKHGIPIEHCKPDERKHRLAEKRLPQDPNFRGVFLILVAKAPARVWKVKRARNGQPHLQTQSPWPYVNHYHFLSYYRSGLGAPDREDERSPPVRLPDHAQRSRMVGASGPAADPCWGNIQQGG